MILVADSGATKCDWKFAKNGHNGNEEELPKVSTMGFSPFFHSKDFIADEIRKEADLNAQATEVDKIFYYGTGCSSEDRKEHIKTALQAIFNKADILVDHDLTGAALAACMGEEGIACILGTGSNSCYFKDGKVFEDVPALGHKLGDEGSGAYFGKKILRGFLYRRLPDYLMDKLKNEYGLSKEIIFDNVYVQGHENVYMASFMKSLSEFKEERWVKDFIRTGLKEFADIHITGYENYKEVPVNFIGSVAYYFQDDLQFVADHFGFKIGRIIKQPIHNLVEYHLLNS